MPNVIIKTITIQPFTSKKEKGQFFSFFFLFDTFGVLVVEFLEDQQKEQKKYNRSLSYLEQPIL